MQQRSRETELSKVAKAAEHLVEETTKEAQKTIRPTLVKFPLLYGLLVTFGVVATLYGFERIINGIPFLADRPFYILGIGIVTLIFTGTLYKKLG